jgi:hypothetical protein
MSNTLPLVAAAAGVPQTADPLRLPAATVVTANCGNETKCPAPQKARIPMQLEQRQLVLTWGSRIRRREFIAGWAAWLGHSAL